MAGISTAVHHAITDPAHDVLTSGHYRYGVAVANRLGKGAQVGLETHQFLHTAFCDPEARLDLIDNHDDLVFFAQFPGCPQIFLVCRD